VVVVSQTSKALGLGYQCGVFYSASKAGCQCFNGGILPAKTIAVKI